jgi:outer membrane lipase/esterase
MKVFQYTFLTTAFISTTLAIPISPGETLVVFGDSISDNGNVFKLTDQRWPPQPYWAGRFSNGPVWNEVFAADANSQLRNYAYGSATSGCVAGATEGGKTPVPNAIQQVEQYLKDGVNMFALHMLEFGANDAFFSVFGAANPPANGQCVLDHVSMAMWKLIDAGVRDIVVWEMPNFGVLPILADAGEPYVSNALLLSTQFNLGLPAAVANQQRAGKSVGKSVNIRILPFYSMMTSMWTNPPDPVNITDEACLIDMQLCQQAKQDGNQSVNYFYYDDAHFTKWIHITLAKKIEAWYQS